MAYISFVCANRELPSVEPIKIPNFGEFLPAYGPLGHIPDASEVLALLKDKVALAMAPTKWVMQLLGVVQALQNCFKAIPDAITQVSAKPVYKCIEELNKAIGGLVNFFPPFQYVPTFVSLVRYVMNLIATSVLYFQRLDARIAQLINSYTMALQYQDQKLMDFANCGSNEMIPQVTSAMELLLFAMPILSALLDMMIKFYPNLALDILKTAIDATVVWLAKGILLLKTITPRTQISVVHPPTKPPAPQFDPLPIMSTVSKGASAAGHVLCALPPLGVLVEGITYFHNLLVPAYNFAAPIAGGSGTASKLKVVTFVYL